MSEEKDELHILETPELSDWECELFGMGPMGFVFRPLKGNEPNWFWRKMQYLCFGNKWIYSPEEGE